VRLVGVGGLSSGGGVAQLSLLASDTQGGDETPWSEPPGDQSISDA
jgi:hypothetical protein